MVVCKCRKSTKFYCFVHKAPVCYECVCSPDHRLCVIRSYSEWVLDGDYDWPPHCVLCQQVLNEEEPTTRLPCFHVLHTTCLESLLKNKPVGPASNHCPACSTQIWPPPKDFKSLNSGLPLKLKEAIVQVGAADAFSDINLNTPSNQVADSAVQERSNGTLPAATSEIVEEYSLPMASKKPVTTSSTTDYQETMSQQDYDDDDEKYRRRGWAAHKLLPSWASNQPVLPITRDDRRHLHRTSRANRRTWLLVVALLSTLATISLLYYRL